MYNQCSDVPWILRGDCRYQAEVYYTVVWLVGEGPHANAQRAACICCDEPNPEPGCPNHEPDPDPDEGEPEPPSGVSGSGCEICER